MAGTALLVIAACCACALPSDAAGAVFVVAAPLPSRSPPRALDVDTRIMVLEPAEMLVEGAATLEPLRIAGRSALVLINGVVEVVVGLSEVVDVVSLVAETVTVCGVVDVD